MAWTDEKKELVVAQYVEIMENQFDTDEQRASASMEVVTQLAEEHGETPNGTRMILSRAGVYIKKAPTAKSSTPSAGSGGGKRINKAEAIQALRNSIAAIDPALVQDEILDKLTGKAAAYFVEVITATTASE